MDQRRWLLEIAVLSLSLSWMAAETGGYLIEEGPKLWTVPGNSIHLKVTRLSGNNGIFTLLGFLLFYVLRWIIALNLVFRCAHLGRSSLHSGRCGHEMNGAA